MVYIEIEINNNAIDNNIIQKIENDILHKYSSKKIISNKLYDQIQYCIKKYNNSIIILKISGIWKQIK